MMERKTLAILGAAAIIFVISIIATDYSLGQSIVNSQIGSLASYSPSALVSTPCLRSDEISESYAKVSEQFQTLRKKIKNSLSYTQNDTALSESGIDDLLPDIPLTQFDLSEPCIPLHTITNGNKKILKKLRDLKTFFESKEDLFSGKQIVTKAPSYKDVFRDFLHENQQLSKEYDRRPAFHITEHEPQPFAGGDRPKYTLSGLRTFTAGEEGALTLDTHGAVLPRSPVELVRVLFYGIAVAAPREWVGNESGVWAARFRLVDPGLYRVHVECVRAAAAGFTPTARPVEGSPFALLVRPAGSDGQSDKQVRSQAPSSSVTVPSRRPDSLAAQP
jgi:hypothetical protein